jgi:hypothetical protein
LAAKSYVDNYRTPHTDQLHVVERWKLAADAKTVDVSVFVEDPGAFTMPWSAVQRWRRVEGAPYRPTPCNENNGDFFNQGLVPLKVISASGRRLRRVPLGLQSDC